MGSGKTAAVGTSGRTNYIPKEHQSELRIQLKTVPRPMRRAVRDAVAVYYETERFLAPSAVTLEGAKTLVTLSKVTAQHLPKEQALKSIAGFRDGLLAAHAERTALLSSAHQFLNSSDGTVKANAALELAATLPTYLGKSPGFDEIRKRLVFLLNDCEGRYVDVPRNGHRLADGKVELSYAIPPEALRSALSTLLEQPLVPELQAYVVRTHRDSEADRKPGSYVECFIDGARTFVPEVDTVGVPMVTYALRRPSDT